jgi:hypothetical protein
MTVEAAILSSNYAMREGVGSWRLSPSMGLLGSRTERTRSPSSAVRAPLGCCSPQVVASRMLVGPLAPLLTPRNSSVRLELSRETIPPSNPVRPAHLSGFCACCLTLMSLHWSQSLRPHTRLSHWKPLPLASVDGWILHASGDGVSSRTVPSLMRLESASSNADLVAKG